MTEHPNSRVLLAVDDEDDMRFLLQLFLRPAGYDVRIASDGLEAMATLDHTAVDLVLLDLRMPRLDGWGVLKRMREDPALARIPIIVLSAHADDKTAEAALAAGAAAFMNKPFSQAGLLDALREQFDVRGDE